MSEKRRGLGRGLGALIPTGGDTARSGRERPVDVFFPDSTESRAAGDDGPDGAGSGADPVTESGLAVRTAPGTSSGSVVGVPEARPSEEGSGAVASGAATSGTATSGTATSGTATSGTATSGTDASGRGLEEGDDLVPVPGATFAEIAVADIRPNPRQPRDVFDEDALTELVGSIREVGVLQPVVVREVAGGYELIMGERRLRASQLAGLERIPAIIRETADEDLLRDALLENLHRVQLNPLEEAAAYRQLLDDFGCTQEELATKIHRSRPQISNTLRLLKLPPLVQRRVAAGVLSAGHARALLALPDAAGVERLAQRIVAEGLSVRAVEEIVALGGEEAKPARRVAPRAGERSEALDSLAARLSDRLDTRVTVGLGKRKGRLTVEFASVQDLNRILAVLAPEDPGLFHR